MVGHLIRLRFAIQSHTLGWKRKLGAALGLAGGALTWAAVIAADDPARHDVAVLALTMWLVGWVVGPILTSGASVLRPEYFVLLPLDRRRIGLGLLVTVFVGVGALVTVLGFLSIIGYAVLRGSWAAVAVAVPVTALFTVGVVAFARTVYAVLGAAMRTRLGVEIAAVQYGVLLAGLFAGWLVVNPVVSATPVLLSDGLASVPAAAAILDALPPGWVIRAVDAAVIGDLPAVLGWGGLVAVFAVGSSALAVRLLVPDVSGRTRRRIRRRTPRRDVLPATVLSAVVGKELRMWWRDPWRSLEVRSSIWFGIVLAVLLALGGAAQWAAWSALAVALMTALSGANLYGQDGTALWQLVVAQSRSAVRADVRGRQLAIVLAMGTPALLLTLVIAAVTSSWTMVAPIVVAITAVLGVGSGVASILSVLAVTPGVEPAKRVNPNDAGENSLAIQVGLWSTMVLTVPTSGPLTYYVGTGTVMPGWLAIVAIMNAGIVAWLGGAIAIRLLDAGLPETFARLRYPKLKIRQDATDTSLFTRFASKAEKTAQEERATREGKTPQRRADSAD